MKCSHCGFPLAPKRTRCPKCGNSTTGESERGSSSNNQRPEAFVLPQAGFGPAGIQSRPAQQQQGTYAPTTPYDPRGIQGPPFGQQIPFAAYQPAQGQKNTSMGSTPTFHAPPIATPISTSQAQQSQVWSSNVPVNTPLPISNLPWPPQSSLNAPPPRQEAQASGTFIQPPHTSVEQSTGKRPMPLGFTVAGLCVVTGGLILAFVYIMTIGLSGLPTSSTSAQPSNTSLRSTTTHGTKAGTKATSTLSPGATPGLNSTPSTTAFPGQQYIDQAQTASSINTVTALPITLTTTFKVMQQINVTFRLHPGTQGGEVCLNWFLNNQQFTQYHFSVKAISLPAYSYAFANSPGSAYVEISWATSPSCADKILAQRVSFTVTP